MPLASGTRLGPYEIVAPLGTGGMGEVYKAKDVRLDRLVAIKVLPDVLAVDPQFRERFDREARSISALDHPHICALYDVGEQDGTSYLVMQYLEGETLAERLTKGPLALHDALRIAIEMADALAKAHRAGIVHRDLKPGNVMLTKSGAKLLDFGLAKSGAPAVTGVGATVLPTTPINLTAQGTILGTFQYMAPEQIEGKEADPRTDIFALGVVLYEMTAGRKAFEGKTQAGLIGAILERDPPAVSSVGPALPASIDRVIATCIAKDPDERWQSARDLLRELKWIAEAPAQPAEAPATVTPAARGSFLGRARVAWSAATVLLAATIGVAALAYVLRSPADTRTIRFAMPPPDGWSVALSIASSGAIAAPLAVAPDGQRVAIVARNADGKDALWIRPLDALTAQQLPGTDGASSPFWSPDSRSLGFFADGKLKKIDVTGGPPITLCDTPDHRGGAWSGDGVIIFSPYTAPAALLRVPASGGVPTPATTLSQGETGHTRPSFLPDGRHFFYRVLPTGGPIYIGSLDSPTARTLLFKSPDASNVLYSQGHVLFLRETTLMAQPFDVKRLALTGEPFPVADRIQTLGTPPLAVFSVAATGVLVYQTGTAAVNPQLTWLDRAGKRTGALGDPGRYSDLQFSPDGRRLSVGLLDLSKGTSDIWIYDVARGLRTRFTFDPADELSSIWSPDGGRVVYNSRRKGHFDLYQKASSGAGAEEVLLADTTDKYPTSWSPDGRTILYTAVGTTADIFVLPLSGDRTSFPYLQTPFAEGAGQFSPDGRWVAYQSNESGRGEVYVAPFPGPGGKWQISTFGGSSPRWRRDGNEILYRTIDNKLWAAAVNGRASGFEVGDVRALFASPLFGGRYVYDVTPDGQRFLANVIGELSASVPPLTAVVNWLPGSRK